MGQTKCVALTDKQLKVIKDKKWHVYDNGGIKYTLSDASILATLTKLQSQENNPISFLSEEDFKKAILMRSGEIMQALVNAAEEQIAENAASKILTIEGAKVQINTSKSKLFTKNDPRNNKDTLFVFSDNLQAYLYYASEEDKARYSNIATKLSEEDYNKMLDVSKSSAIVRTVSKGSIEKTPNAIGFVVKKNAYNNGIFTNTDSDQFTDEESTQFEEINTAIARQIKKLITDNKYTKVRIVGTLAGEKARLTHKNAEILQKILKDELGIESIIKKVNEQPGDWYKVELQNTNVPSYTRRVSAKQAAIDAEALESLKAQMPEYDFETLETNLKAWRASNDAILSAVYPDIAQRRARVDYILNEFRDRLTYWIAEQVDMLQDMQKNNPEAFDNPATFTSITPREVLEGLTEGTEAENRTFAIRNLTAVDSDKNITNIPSAIYREIFKDFKSTTEAAFESPEDKAPKDEWVKEFASTVLLNNDYPLGADFLQECEDKNWQGKTAEREALKRARHLAYEYRKMANKQVFDALVKESKFELEKLENISLDVFGNSVNTTEEEQQAELREENTNPNKEGYMIHYKMLDPKGSLSVKMKVLLSTLYKTKTLKGGYVVHTYNDLGGMLKVPFNQAYFTILEGFKNVISETDMDEVMKDLVSRNPWLYEIYPRVCKVPGAEEYFDFELRKEFFTQFYQTPIEYVKMAGGFLVSCNKDAEAATFLAHTANNIEGHIVLGPKSIYNEDGQINLSNVKAIHNLFEQGKKLFVVKNTLKKALRGEASINEINNALITLRNEDLLKNTLNNIGVSTDNIDLDILLPAKDVDEYKDVYGERVNDFIQDIGSKKISSLIKILEQIQVITNQSDNSDSAYSLREGDIPTSKFQKSYLSLGHALKEPSDGYTNQSFLGPDGNARFSYTYPDFISIITRAINREDPEKARQYIIENYGNIDYFRDQSQSDMRFGWKNKFLADFMQSEKETTNWRKDFRTVQVLSMLDSKGRPTEIRNVKEYDLYRNLFAAFRGSLESESGTTMAYYRNPLFSDVDAIVYFRCRRYTGATYVDDIISNMIDVFDQEYNRILDLRRDKGKVTIENYNDKRGNGLKFCLLPELNKGKQVILSTGEQLNIPGIEEIDAQLGKMLTDASTYSESKKEYVRGIISDLLKYKFDQFLTELALDDNKVTELKKLMDKQDNYNNKDAITTEELLKELAEGDKEQEQEKNTLEDTLSKNRELVIEALREYFYNDYFAQSQIVQLTFGDIAFSKNFRDFIKRNKQMYASGPRLYCLDEEGNPLVETCMYAEDLEGTSNSYAFIAKLLEQDQTMSRLQKDLLKGSIHAFMGSITKTDGQSLRTMKSFKKIFEAAGGKWTPAMERAYRNVLSGTLTTNEFKTLWNQIKPFVYSHESIRLGKRTDWSPVQHKNSEYMLSAAFTALNMALNKSPELIALQKFMENNDIDVLHFHSSVKLGFHTGIDLNHDDKRFKQDYPKISYKDYIKKLDSQLENGKISQEEYNTAVNKYRFRNEYEAMDAINEQVGVHDSNGNLVYDEDGALVIQSDKKVVLPLKDLMFAQPSADHLTDEEALIGSQLKNIIPADLPEDFTMDVILNGKKVTLNRDQSVTYYNQLLVDMMLVAYKRVYNEFATIQDLQAALFAKMEGNDKYGKDVRDALEIENGHFKLPFISPNLTNKIEELILSTFKNAIQKQKIRGGNAVLVSNYGLDDRLHVQWKNIHTGELIKSSEELKNMRKEDLAVAWIPCYLPFYSSEMLRDFLELTEDGYYTVNFEKMESQLGKSGASKLLEVIGYRIPTEDKYSIMPIKIVGFLPEIAGTSMMLPADIITMSGTDFDIDKLFLMIRSSRREIYNASLVEDYIEWFKNTVGRKEEQRNQIIAGLMSSLFDFQEKARENNPKDEQNNTLMDALSTLYNTNRTPEEDKAVAKARKFLGTFKKGFTEQEIASLRKQSKLFDRFLEEGGGAKARYNTPQYRVAEPEIQYDANGNIDLSETSLKAKPEERHNMFIDVVWGVLTSNAGSKLSMLPGSYSNVKHASRVERIKHDKTALKEFIKSKKDLINSFEGSVHKALASLPTDELDSFYEEHATIQSPLSIVDFTSNFRNLMDGGDLIGHFAVSSSNHYKFQFLDLKLSPKYQFKIRTEGGKVVTITDVDPLTSPITGISIGRACAESQAASPDNGKDPCLGDLNINPETASFVEYLTRIGMTYTCIGAVNTSMPIVEIGLNIIKESQNRIKPCELQNFILDEAKVSDLFIKYQVSENPDTFVAQLSADDKEYLVNYANWFKMSNFGPGQGVQSPASLLNSASSVSRSDSPNGALQISVAECVQQRAKAEEFVAAAKRHDAAIFGIDKVVDIDVDPNNYDWSEGIPKELRNVFMKSPIARLQASHTLGIVGGRGLSSKYLPQLNDASYAAFNYLRSQTKKTFLTSTSESTIKKFFSSMLMYVLSDSEIFAGQNTDKSKGLMNRRNYYIHDFPMQLKAILQEKDDKGNYVYQKVRDLNIIQHISNKSGRGIKFENVGSVQKDARIQYQEELLSMLSMGEKEAKLALQLFMYSYYDNGLAFRHNSFGLFFTTKFMETMPNYVSALYAAQSNILNGNRKMADSTGSTARLNYLQNFVIQFLLNNPDLLLSASPRKDYTITASEIDNDGFKSKTKIRLTEVGINKMTSVSDAGHLIEIIRVGNDVFRLTDEEHAEYTKFPYSITLGCPYYDANSPYYEVNLTKIKDRGVLTKLPNGDKTKSSHIPSESRSIKNFDNIPTEGSRAETSFDKIPMEGSVTTTIDRAVAYNQLMDDQRGWDNKEIPNEPSEENYNHSMSSVDRAEAIGNAGADILDRINNIDNFDERIPTEPEQKKNLDDVIPNEELKDELCPPSIINDKI